MNKVRIYYKKGCNFDGTDRPPFDTTESNLQYHQSIHAEKISKVVKLDKDGNEIIVVKTSKSVNFKTIVSPPIAGIPMEQPMIKLPAKARSKAKSRSRK